MRKRRRIRNIIAVIMIISGVCVFLLPRVTDQLYRNNVRQELEDFEESKEDPDDGDGDAEESSTNASYEALYQLMVQKNIELYQNGQDNVLTAANYVTPEIDLSEYGLTDDTVGYISIPKMDVVLPILLGASDANMAKGAVHLTGSSYPVGGENTNCVIAAHRGYSYTAMFRNIQLLETGDYVYIENFRETLTYQVTDIQIIEPDDMEAVYIQEGKDMVSLITCHPYPYNYQRYVVFCERVS